MPYAYLPPSLSLWFSLQDIPIVIAGNKADLASSHREVRQEEVTDWVFCELPRLRWVNTRPFPPSAQRRLN